MNNNAIMNNGILSVCLDPDATFLNPYWASPHYSCRSRGLGKQPLITEGAIARYIGSYQPLYRQLPVVSQLPLISQPLPLPSVP